MPTTLPRMKSNEQFKAGAVDLYIYFQTLYIKNELSVDIFSYCTLLLKIV